MTRVEYLQEKHDVLIKQIEDELRVNFPDHIAEKMIRLVNHYGDTCIKLVEAEHAECGS